jgi:DNA adenine methylase
MQYPGGKNSAYRTIINQIPPHEMRVEAFAGSGILTRLMRPAHVNVAIDIYTGQTEILKAAVPGAVVINGDTISILPEIVARSGYAAEKIFVYADPPYLKQDIDGTLVRSSQRDIYEHEFCTVEEHRTLLTLLKSLGCMVMISGYWSMLYMQELQGWRTFSYNAVKRSGEVVKEFLWMNYPAPVALHDYSFLGNGRTDRQRIKRKIERWTKKLQTMPVLEKQVLLQAIQNLDLA